MQDEAPCVYVRSPIEVHYVDINNSAQKCRPSWVSLCLAVDAAPANSAGAKASEITKEPQTKLFHPDVCALCKSGEDD